MKKFSFTIRGNRYEVEIQQFENNIAEMEVNGSHYTVEVHEEVRPSKTPTILVRKEVPDPRRSEVKIRKTIGSALQMKSPLPGTVMQVLVKSGDNVKKGQKLLVYEAMKMENSILAERDGQITAVRVQPGDNVLEGDVLVEMS
ncbi:MAG: biotin/lipoyl-binding protein [Bacteroidales bacterium]|nr:biotin/lipoyl-binding protein [Bacteroidales bacterium]